MPLNEFFDVVGHGRVIMNRMMRRFSMIAKILGYGECPRIGRSTMLHGPQHKQPVEGLVLAL